LPRRASFSQTPIELRAAATGALVGVLAWCAPVHGHAHGERQAARQPGNAVLLAGGHERHIAARRPHECLAELQTVRGIGGAETQVDEVHA